ncbi:oxysterol-binding protein-related protein 8 isoform 2-T2 [Discoglossus pictus]
METVVSEGEPERTSHHSDRESHGSPHLVASSDESQLSLPAKMSQRQSKDAYLSPTKDLVQATLSPGIIHSHGFDRGKDEVLQCKEDSSHSMSKSKSESKLYNGSEKDIASASSKLTKKESLKVQKKNYREEKKRATKELLSTITDPSVIVMSDWLKIRGTLKSWTKLWCVLKPGVLLIYKTNKNGQWVGTVLLNACEIIERPSKKDGFCFKLFHPLEQSIWAVKGPKGEGVGSITQPLPSSYLIIRAASESDGRCWMDALELALKCSSLLKRTMIREGKEHDINSSGENSHVSFYGLLRANNLHSNENFQQQSISLMSEGSYLANSAILYRLNDSEIERQHFKDQDTYSDKSDKDLDHDHDESDNEGKSEESDSDTSERQDDSFVDPDPTDSLKETTYLEEVHEELGEAGEASQTETVSEEHKSLIWTLLKQVRPGMDLSKVVLPTFILEPRSFLDKLSDYYYHADFLSEAAVEENAYSRMKKVVKWYLSGFYKKPKGLKKPYNPILGETFRCLWIHPTTNSKTFYIAEQVSHHPPVSAFYVSNRKDGFCLSGSILAKSKFYGNSLSALLEGEGRLTFLNRGEDYAMSMPYAHCKGILYGTMTLELGGNVTITCEKTGYSAILEFKLKPFLGSEDCVNEISGKIKLGKEVLATLHGHWDSEVTINDKKTDVSETFWNPTQEMKQRRLTRCTVLKEEQGEFESERLWQHVTRAINHKDQMEATQEKFVLEEAQRKAAKERKATGEEWTCKLFEHDPVSGEWHYRYADTRPWDPLNDLVQFEKEGAVQTKVRHRTPMVCVPKLKHKTSSQSKKGESGCSSPELDHQDSSGSEAQLLTHSTRVRKKGTDHSELQSAIESIKRTQEEINRNIIALRNRLTTNTSSESSFLQQRDYCIIFFLIFVQIAINYLFK